MCTSPVHCVANVPERHARAQRHDYARHLAARDADIGHLGPGRAQKSLHIMVTDTARPATGAQPQPPSVGAVDDPRVRRAMLQIEQNLSTPQKVEDIAQGVGLSKRQLERIFRKVVGKSIQEFSRELRVFYGLWLLTNSARTITAVATESGFSDISHFRLNA